MKQLYLKRLLLLAICAVAVVSPCSLTAQSTSGSISGLVLDDSGAGIPGVTVTAVSTSTGATRSSLSTDRGAFTIPLVPPGVYDVSAELSGFRPVKTSGVRVNVGTDASVRLQMRIGVEESVTVTAAAPLIETSRSQVSSVVGEEMIENLPTNGRNFIDFVLTTPGVVRDVRQGDISFAGQRGTLNSLVVDGANNDNTFFGQALGRTGSGRAPYQFSQDAVKEFVVNSNAYSAEYGRAGGAVINVITKSGTNDFDGTGFYFLRDKRYNANDYINVINNRVKSPYHFDQFGLSVGGPIVRDRHFFFANYDAQRNSIEQIVVLGGRPYPTDAASQAGLAKLQALAGNYPRNQDQDVYLLKTDHEILAKSHLSLRYNRQEFTGLNFESGGTTIAEEHSGNSLVKTDTLSGVLTTPFNASLFNEVRGQYAKDQEPGTANTAAPEAVIRQNGPVLTIGRNFFSPRETTIKRNQIADTVTYLWNTHTFKGGFDVSKDDILNFFPGNFSGSYTFTSLANFQNGIVNRYVQAFPGPGTSGPTTNPNILETALFIQDEWRIRPSLTLNAGLRYDKQSIEQSQVRNPDAQLAAAGIDTRVVPEDSNNIGPRVGFAWNPGQNNRTVIRGGYGTFYGRTPAIMIGTAHSNNGINVQTITFTGTQVPVYPNIFPALPTGAALPGPTIVVFDKDFENPTVHQASVGVEQGLTNDLSIGVSYQYVRGENLQRSIDTNVGASSIVTSAISTGGSVSYKRYSSVRPFSNFGRIIEFQSTARSEYNGVTLDLNKRFSENWQARLAYTWSEVMDTRPDATAVVPGGSDDAKYAQDPLDLEGDWAPGDNDVRHRVVLSGVWNLDSYASGLNNSFVRGLFGGWGLSGIASYQTGQPYSPRVFVDLNGDGNALNDRAPGFKRNSFRLPSQFLIEPRITKDIPLAGDLSVQLIAEAFNLLNRSNVSFVNTGFYNFNATTSTLTPIANFGAPTGSAGPRIVQIAAKLRF